MRKSLLAVAAAAAFALPTASRAQVTLGVRAGYSFPSGTALSIPGQGTFSQSDLTKGTIPIEFDASLDLPLGLSAGLYYSYGFGSVGNKLSQLCTGGATCNRPEIQRAGVQAAFELPALLGFAPWVGAGYGIEMASFGVNNFTYGKTSTTPPQPLTGNLDGNLRGWDTSLQAGLDFHFIPFIGFGPFVQVDFGQYTVQDIKLGALGTVAGGAVNPRSTHETVTVGVRGTIGL